MVFDHRHGFVCGADTSHGPMLRAWECRVMTPAGMHADPLVARHEEADDPMRTNRAVRIGRVVVRHPPVLRRIGAVVKVCQCGGTVHIVICLPRADQRRAVIVKMNLVGRAIQY